MIRVAPPRDEPPRPGVAPRRGGFAWVKWLLGAALVVLLTVEAVYLWPTLSDSWRALTEMHWGWFAACIAAQAAALSGFAGVQQRLLHAGGVTVGHLRSASVVYASTAMSVTLPAGPVFSTAFTYKETRRWGATPVVASWQLAVSGVIATATLAAVGVTGALAVGSRVSPVTLVLAVAGAFALFYGLRHVARNPSSIQALGLWLIHRVNRIAKKPAETGVEAFERILGQLESVELGRRDALTALGWSGVHRVCDVACLGLACWTVGGDPSLPGLLIAFAAAKAVASVPLAPGGLGFVDGTLIATLTAAGMSASQSLAAVFVYRVVSFVIVAVVGWIVIAVLYRSHRIDDAELDLEREHRARSLLSRRRDADPDDQPERDPDRTSS
nr:YbhN family protein [Rhodococcus phenolicus]